MRDLPALPEPSELARRLLAGGGRVLVAGAIGTGKSTLVESLADRFAAASGGCPAITADLGQPLFGPPGAVSLANRRDRRWRLEAVAALASLDAARFRLPLLEAVLRLVRTVAGGPLLVDAPGLFRGMAAAELLPGLVRAAAIAQVVVLVRGREAAAVLDDLRASGAAVHLYGAPASARADNQRRRVARRSAAWQEWLDGARPVVLDLDRVPVTGAPPPRSAAGEWRGRQAVVLDRDGTTAGFGEVVELRGGRLTILAPAFDPDPAAAVVVRDARRGEDGALRTAGRVGEPVAVPASAVGAAIELPPPGGGRVSRLQGTLVGGLFGDPLLLLRHISSGRHLLLDLGEHFELPARVAHRVSDLFLTHGHLDHLAGFPWLLRRRIGVAEVCRIWGPAGTAESVCSFVRAVTWDRIGGDGPRFVIAELAGTRLRRWRLQVGRGGLEEEAGEDVEDGVIHREGELRVRAAVLEHGTPVVAYAVEERRQLAVRAERVAERGLEPGPWLGRVLGLLEEGRPGEEVDLPDGARVAAGELARELVEEREGQKLVYACDLADLPGNREALVALARGAQLLVCEAAFAEAERARALETGHLTARACGEIAAAAGVERLLPFHLSDRYRERPQAVLAELRATFDRLWLPRPLRHLAAGDARGDPEVADGDDLPG